MSSIRFFHAADLHLDSPFKGISNLPHKLHQTLRNSTFDAYTRLIDLALEHKPDFLLIVGDIYDGEERSLKAQAHFLRGMEKLEQAGIPVFISHGNHDHLSGKWTRFQLPANVHVFGNETSSASLQVNGETVVIHGFSYPERHVKKSRMTSYIPRENPKEIHIGMLHGSIAGDTSHDVYAPFTKEELLSKNYHYWALGHIHKRQILHRDPSIVYPGNSQSRHRNEQGEKGFYEVTIDTNGTELAFHVTSQVVYERVEVKCPELQHANDFYRFIEEVCDDTRTRVGTAIVDIRLTAVGETAKELLESTPLDEWLESLREAEEMHDPTVFIRSIELEKPTQMNPSENSLAGILLQTMAAWDDKEWKTVVKDVHQHARLSKYLEPLSMEEKEEVANEATKIIISHVASEE
ncbi:metallophosphoesterase family protein [Paenisporosarcina cavernae]|uniref:DNA repair exonuclease n=1 Tax=Paenisporosarcina cavernae TaxID=2320858 RepID=A0A385YWA0_9BACL|nr:DNA repair exonuclease [Paenisporosarcina cavernae]AYC30177.1 DNA repair exonuclease [Paenisporosarcina cavernae]